MWAHYARNFSGISIEYNVKRLLDNLDEDNELVRMTYSEKAPMLYRDKETAANRAKMILSCKSVRWASEREWRLIRPTVGPAHYRRKTVVTSVFLGSRITEEHEATIRSELAPLKIPVRKMEVDTYAIAFEPKRMIKRKTSKPKAGR